jgi:hypothetical protein
MTLMKVWCLSGLVAGDSGPFRWKGNHPTTCRGAKALQMARPPHNSGGQKIKDNLHKIWRTLQGYGRSEMKLACIKSEGLAIDRGF